MEISDAHIRAGVFFTSTSMRYAEIEKHGDENRLLRLGSCDFSFNPLDQFQSESDAHFESLTSAVGEVLSSSRASRVHIALHPKLAHSFFSPIANSLTRTQARRQIAEEARMLYPDNGSAGIISRRLDNVVVSGGAKHGWVHITAVPSKIRSRLQRIMQGLSDKVCVGIPLAESVVSVLNRVQGDESSAYTLMVGLFNGGLELMLCKRGKLHFAQSVNFSGAPSDAVYWATNLCRRLNVSANELDLIYMFGERTDRTIERLLASSFEALVQGLDPMQAVNVNRGRVASEFDHSSYAPCIGVVI